MRALPTPYSYLAGVAYGAAVLVCMWAHFRRWAYLSFADIARCRPRRAPGTWPLHRWMTGTMLLASTCRLVMLFLVGLIEPSGGCANVRAVCHAVAVVVPGIAFASAWSSSLLVLLFLSELRTAYMSVQQTRSYMLRQVAVAVAIFGTIFTLVIRMVPWPPMSTIPGEKAHLKSKWSEASHTLLTGFELLFVLALFFKRPFFLPSLLRVARVRGQATNQVLRWVLVIIALLIASAGRFLFELVFALEVSWARNMLQWQNPLGTAYFFCFGNLPDLLVILALTDAVTITRFSRHGAVPWLLRIQLSEVDLADELGRGSFASVYLGSWRGAPVAVKRLRTHGLSACEVAELQQDLEGEAALLSKEVLRHRHIVTFIGLLVDPAGGASLLMTDFAPNGSLAGLLAVEGRSDEGEAPEGTAW